MPFTAESPIAPPKPALAVPGTALTLAPPISANGKGPSTRQTPAHEPADMDKNKPNIENVKSLKKYLYRNGFNELILEVTTSCNLRCKYCVFSGNYDGQRNHGSEKMELETAIKAIKIYFNVSVKK